MGRSPLRADEGVCNWPARLRQPVAAGLLAAVEACTNGSATSTPGAKDAALADATRESARSDWDAEDRDVAAATEGEAGPQDASTATICDAAVAAGARVITLVNACPSQTIRIGVSGGYVQDCDAGGCPQGTNCNTTRSPPGCFWDLPAPSCGGNVLPVGGSATYVLSAPAIAATGGASITWSGNVYASTGCAPDGTGCTTAQCAVSAAGKTTIGPCLNGVGPQGPTTLAEFTLATNGPDYYDISAINGVNVPVSMAPIAGAADPSNPYSCGAAGSAIQTTGLASCSWSFDTQVTLSNVSTDESTILRAVAPGGTPCTSNAQCAAPDVCGTALAFGESALVQTCGRQVAWWTADELCAFTGSHFGAPLDCDRAVAGQGSFASLYGCTGPENASSCYGVGANSACCGCPDWNVGGQTLQVPSSFSCGNTNAQWQSIAEPWAAFVKNACPTAYSFPFDDATSTFTCSTPTPGPNAPNRVGYTITFCPGGLTGF